jgi:hypothetical protein
MKKKWAHVHRGKADRALCYSPSASLTGLQPNKVLHRSLACGPG